MYSRCANLWYFLSCKPNEDPDPTRCELPTPSTSHKTFHSPPPWGAQGSTTPLCVDNTQAVINYMAWMGRHPCFDTLSALPGFISCSWFEWWPLTSGLESCSQLITWLCCKTRQRNNSFKTLHGDNAIHRPFETNNRLEMLFFWVQSSDHSRHDSSVVEVPLHNLGNFISSTLPL